MCVRGCFYMCGCVHVFGCVWLRGCVDVFVGVVGCVFGCECG